jgi:hypothetical protein
VCQLTNDDQQQRFTKVLRQPVQGSLHLIRVIVGQGVVRVNGQFQRLFARQGCRRLPFPPTIHDTTAKDRRQPCSVASPRLIPRTALPSGTKRLLHQIFRLVRITHHAVGHPIQGRPVLVHKFAEFRLRKCHGQPLFVPVAARRDSLPAVIFLITARQDSFATAKTPRATVPRRNSSCLVATHRASSQLIVAEQSTSWPSNQRRR